MKHSIEFPVKIFATGSAKVLAEMTVERLKEVLPEKFWPEEGLKLNSYNVLQFSNKEMLIQPEDVRGHFVVIIHTRSERIHKELAEFFWLSDAIINAGVDAKNVLVVFPYMPYSRSDKKDQSRISVPSSFLARTINRVFRFKKILLVEPHDAHICYYFDPYAKHISTENLFIYFIKKEILNRYNKEELVFVFPDAGGAKRYASIPEKLGISSAYIDKERRNDELIFKEIVGEVKDKVCIFVDDEISSGGTIMGNAEIVKRKKAKSVIALITHATLSHKKLNTQQLMEELKNCDVDEFVVTDTIPVRKKIKGWENFTLLPISGLLAQAIKHVVIGKSLSPFYSKELVKKYYCPPKKIKGG